MLSITRTGNIYLIGPGWRCDLSNPESEPEGFTVRHVSLKEVYPGNRELMQAHTLQEASGLTLKQALFCVHNLLWLLAIADGDMRQVEM